MILAWSANAHDAVVANDGYAFPLGAVRILAMVHLAQHDAVDAVVPVYDTYAFDRRDAEADPIAAAAAAA